MNDLKKPFWSIDLEEILKNFNVDPSIGLSEEEVQKRKKEFGPNVIVPPPESVSSDEVIKYTKLIGIAVIFIDLIIFLAIFIPTAIFCGIVSILGDGGLTMTIVIFISMAILKSYQITLLFRISTILKPWLDEKLKVEEGEKNKTTVLRDGREQKINNDELRALFVYDLDINSCASGDIILGREASFLRVAQKAPKARKNKKYK